MTLNQRVLQIALTEPGTSKQRLRRMFGLSEYRLKRVFRRINRELNKRQLVYHDAYGVWIIDVDPAFCTGIEWAGIEAGGARQCHRSPKFDDGRCYEHSECESSEMVALRRKLAALVGPANPSVYALAQLSMPIVEELYADVQAIQPLTRKDRIGRDRLAGMLKATLATLKWKEKMRRLRSGHGWFDPELEWRHRRSSVNPFAFSVRKHFAVLEVSPKATREEVVKAWRQLARKYHPDSEAGDEERMKVINLAKEHIFRFKQWD